EPILELRREQLVGFRMLLTNARDEAPALLGERSELRKRSQLRCRRRLAEVVDIFDGHEPAGDESSHGSGRQLGVADAERAPRGVEAEALLEEGEHGRPAFGQVRGEASVAGDEPDRDTLDTEAVEQDGEVITGLSAELTEPPIG